MLLLRTSRGVDPGIPLLRSLGSNAHVWLPGANGTTVASLPSNNYLLSDGSTGYSTVDGVDGLTLDGMGALGTELVTNGTFGTDLTEWVQTGGDGTITWVAGKARCTGGTLNSFYTQTITNTAGATLYFSYDAAAVSATKYSLRVNGVFIEANQTAFGTRDQYAVVASSSTPVELIVYAGETVDFDNISVKEYTGTHLTQPTTANKPLVRRGMLNLALRSLTPTNAAWVKSGTSTAPNDTTINLPAINDGLYDSVTIAAAAGSTWTGAFVLSGTGTVSVGVLRTVGGAYEEAVASITLTATPTIYAATLTLAGAQTAMGALLVRKAGDTATSVTFGGGGLFKGTFTAAQILAEGGIPTTTATAASNPTSGKYWWGFDGSNDSLLSGNLGITTACTIVVAGRVNTMPSVLAMLFGEDANGVQVYVYPDRSIAVGKNTIAEMLRTSAGVIVAGVPFVITVRLSAGRIDIRKNGALSATALSALTFSATTGMRVGCKFDLTYSLDGALGWVVPLPTGLSDADCLLVERLVSSQFPNGPVF